MIIECIDCLPRDHSYGRLSLLYENDRWGEDRLERLEDEGIGLELLAIYVTSIAQLGSLVDATYAELKAETQGDGH